MPVKITGLRELRAALRAAEDGSVKEITASLKEGAKVVAARAAELAPRGSGEHAGQLAGNGRPYATQRAAGVRYTLVYAPVQEFATTWLRKNRGASGSHVGSSVTRGQKKAHFAGGIHVTGTNEVHYRGDPPRFAYRAVNELGPALVEDTFKALTEILRCHGWFK